MSGATLLGLNQLLLDEQHFLVGWEWPEVIGNDRLESIRYFANTQHSWNNVIAEVFRML